MWVFLLPKTDQLFDRRQISWAKKEKKQKQRIQINKVTADNFRDHINRNHMITLISLPTTLTESDLRTYSYGLGTRENPAPKLI